MKGGFFSDYFLICFCYSLYFVMRISNVVHILVVVRRRI